LPTIPLGVRFRRRPPLSWPADLSLPLDARPKPPRAYFQGCCDVQLDAPTAESEIEAPDRGPPGPPSPVLFPPGAGTTRGAPRTGLRPDAHGPGPDGRRYPLLLGRHQHHD